MWLRRVQGSESSGFLWTEPEPGRAERGLGPPLASGRRIIQALPLFFHGVRCSRRSGRLILTAVLAGLAVGGTCGQAPNPAMPSETSSPGQGEKSARPPGSTSIATHQRLGILKMWSNHLRGSGVAPLVSSIVRHRSSKSLGAGCSSIRTIMWTATEPLVSDGEEQRQGSAGVQVESDGRSC